MVSSAIRTQKQRTELKFVLRLEGASDSFQLRRTGSLWRLVGRWEMVVTRLWW